jgi:hypothetical protein
MNLKAWEAQARAAGWVVQALAGGRLRLACGCPGCDVERTVCADHLPAAPAPCEGPHAAGAGPAALDCYQAVTASLARRRRALGLSQADLDSVLGVADGYIAKLEARHRITSPPVLFYWAEALGLRFEVVPVPLHPATQRAIDARSGNPYQANQARTSDANR